MFCDRFSMPRAVGEGDEIISYLHGFQPNTVTVLVEFDDFPSSRNLNIKILAKTQTNVKVFVSYILFVWL